MIPAIPLRPRAVLTAAWLLLALPAHARAADVAPSLASALRSDGPVLVLDCGASRPHEALADKVADELRPLRGGERPSRAWAGDLERLQWQHANVVLLCDDPGDPALLAVAPGLSLRAGFDRLELTGAEASGADAAAAVTLPHPADEARWVLLLTGTSPAALRRLDRHIRNDITASVLLLDDAGERLATLVRDRGRWRMPPGHPYRPEEVAAAFDARVEELDPRVVGWDLAVTVGAGRLDVVAEVAVEQEGDDGRVWLQLTPRATIAACGEEEACIPLDSRAGRLLLDAPLDEAGRVTLSYHVALEGRHGAWYVAPEGGYVMPSANVVPRVRGAADEPHADRAPWVLALDAAAGAAAVGAGEDGIVRSERATAPLLLWGQHRRVALDGGHVAHLAPGAPDATTERAEALLEELRARLGRDAPGALSLVATQRPSPWYGGGILLAPPELMEPRPLDEFDEWLLDRLATEERVRLADPKGPPSRIKGRVHPASDELTVRLWRLRGAWWQQVDEGPVDAHGAFELVTRGRGELLLTAEAPGFLPVARAVARGEGDAVLDLEPLAEVTLLCLRCGPDGSERRFPLVEVEQGVWRTTVALGEPMRVYGSFPYGFELAPGGAGAVLALDAGGPLDQFPSFLPPDAFHADAVEFEFRASEARFWIEVPGGLLAPVGWIDRGLR